MKFIKGPGSWAVVFSLLLGHDASAGQVVGLRTPQEDFFVAIRGVLPESTLVTGIQFYSNDATVFPAVTLAADMSDSRLPGPETVLRSVENVSGGPGTVTVSFSPYRVTRGQHLWGIVRFPSNAGLRARGMGGGPGIGWRKTRGLKEERSLFSVAGAMNEFVPAFDLSLLTAGGLTSKGTLSDPTPSPTKLPDIFAVQVRPDRQGTVFDLTLPRAGAVTLDIYSIAGRRVEHLDRGILPQGAHALVWHERNPRGGRVPSGVYLYRVSCGEDRRTGKIVLFR